eukprot:scaffold22701_cov123-Cylindrotheca_fusiformis.AAC.9
MSSSQGLDDWTFPSTEEESASILDGPSLHVTHLDARPSSQEDVLKLSVTPKHKSIGIRSDTSWTSACVTILASDLPESFENNTSAVDVTVALDISGSMQGQKLQDCITTLESMLRALGPIDRFGLITFGSEASVVVPAALMTKKSKKAALRKIKALRTKGCTNLSGGLTLAWQEMMLIDSPNPVRSVFLLTDGQANEGITSTPELVNLVKSFNANPDHEALARMSISESNVNGIPTAIALDHKNAPVSLFCFGYGSGHNSDMLRSISQATPGGAYYFVENDSDVSTAFGDAMGGILSVMAQSAVLKISVPPAAAAIGVKIRDIHHDAKVDRGNGLFTVSLGDFYAEESRDVLLDLNLSNVPSDTPVPHFQASLSYMDILNTRTAVAGPVECSIARPDCNEVSEMDMHVESQWLRVCTVRELESADLEAQQLGVGPALERLERAANLIQDSPAYMAGNGLSRALESNIQQVREGFQSERSYQSRGGHSSKNVFCSLKNQRGMASSKTSTGPYQTKRKKAMASKFAPTV